METTNFREVKKQYKTFRRIIKADQILRWIQSFRDNFSLGTIRQPYSVFLVGTISRRRIGIFADCNGFQLIHVKRSTVSYLYVGMVGTSTRRSSSAETYFLGYSSIFS